MNNYKKSNLKLNLSLVLIGVFLGGAMTFFFNSWQMPQNEMVKNAQMTSMGSEEAKPLYWVAPMDDNYRRDKPGKSPMGMELVPVYSQGTGMEESANAIKVLPSVINNLGVRTALARYEVLNSTISTLGYITYDEEKLVDINPRVEGWVEKLYVKAVGEPVKKGQALYQLYSPDLVNAQEEFLLALKNQNERVIQAAKNRLAALHFSKQAINDLKKSRVVNQRVTFYAPQNGVIEKLGIREGAYVKLNTLIFSIVDLTSVWLKAEIFEQQVSSAAMGQKVSMTLEYFPEREWFGVVEHIHPMLNAKTRTAVARLRFDNPLGELKPNMFAQVKIQTENDEKALTIPKESLIRTGKQDRVVLALGDGMFKSIAVNVGRFTAKRVEILAGLKQGDKVVSSAQFLLDSESSKSSDFKRMNTVEANQNTNHSMQENMSENNSEMNTATATGTVNSVMVDHGMINISRSAIEKWGRPAATVDFKASEGVSFGHITLGMEVEFTFEVRNGEFIIINIEPVISSKNSSSINHSITTTGLNAHFACHDLMTNDLISYDLGMS